MFHLPPVSGEGGGDDRRGSSRRVDQPCLCTLRRTDRNYVGTSCEVIEIVGPLLHHLAALGQVLGKVVAGAHRIPIAVCKLALDPL